MYKNWSRACRKADGGDSSWAAHWTRSNQAHRGGREGRNTVVQVVGDVDSPAERGQKRSVHRPEAQLRIAHVGIAGNVNLHCAARTTRRILANYHRKMVVSRIWRISDDWYGYGTKHVTTCGPQGHSQQNCH